MRSHSFGLSRGSAQGMVADGICEPFYDMMQVFHVLAELLPIPFCHYMPAEMMQNLMQLAQTDEGEAASSATHHAKGIIQTLMQHPTCAASLIPRMKHLGKGHQRQAPQLLGVD